MEVFNQQLAQTDRLRSEDNRNRNSPQTLAREALRAAIEKKATDLVVIDIRDVSSVADFFVVCTGDSPRQIKAIADGIREDIRENCDEKPWHTEGYNGLEWILLDYVDVVVHVFNEDKRTFYDLERLWGDVNMAQIEDENVDIALLQE